MCGIGLEIDGPIIHSECDSCILALRDFQVAIDQLAKTLGEPPVSLAYIRTMLARAAIMTGQDGIDMAMECVQKQLREAL